MTPQETAVANALLDAQCAAGRSARDVTELESALRDRLGLMARNLLADPSGLLAALGVETVAHPDGFDIAAYHAESDGCGWYELRTDGTLAPGVEPLYRWPA